MTADPLADVRVNLVRNSGFSWAAASDSRVTVWAKGVAFRGDTLLDASRLCASFLGAVRSIPSDQHLRCLRSLVLELNGSFALVVCTDVLAYAAVDRQRSMPLFYGECAGRLLISDDAEWVRDQLPEVSPDPLCVQEFLLAGYVTGRDTLYRGLRQMQAGEELVCQRHGGRTCPEPRRYYDWVFGDYFDASDEGILDELDTAYVRAFQRLIASAQGRQIALPLSGGLDSRLTALMLKRLGYPRVVCFSYGRPGNAESRVSRCVAERLGFPWAFASYDRESWFAWYRSDEWASYARYASGLCSVPIFQDWPAVRWLGQQGAVASDAIFAPGHTPVMVMQVNELRKLHEQAGAMPLSAQLEAVLRRLHYNLHWCTRGTWEAVFGNRVLPAVQGQPLASVTDVAAVLDRWSWQERQSKFITNSIRAYEPWGHEWRLPLWDNDVMGVWRRVPLELRLHKHFFARYVDRLAQSMGVGELPAAKAPPRDDCIGRKSLKWGLDRLRLRHLAKAPYRAARWAIDYWRHPMAWYGINRYPSHLGHCLRTTGFWAGAFCINSLLAADEIRRLGLDGAVRA